MSEIEPRISKRKSEEIEEEEDKGFYEDEYGHVVLTKKLSSLEPLLPYYIEKIKAYYAAWPSKDFLSKLGPADFVKRRDSEIKGKEWHEAIMSIAPSVVAVSTFGGVRRLVDCSGLIIDWSAGKEEATILTSARLLKFPKGAKRKDYYVAVRFMNGQVHRNVKVANVHNALESVDGAQVVALGRDFFGTFRESKGILHNKYPYFGCPDLWSSTCEITEASEGGPLITKSGLVCGINFNDRNCYANPLLCPIISLCLRIVDTNGRVMIPWFGLTVVDSDELSRDSLQKLCSISGEYATYKTVVIVKEVYEESPANKFGLTAGDFVKSVGGRIVTSSLRFFHLLHVMFEDLNSDSSSSSSSSESCDSREIKVVTFRYGYVEEVILKADCVEVSDQKFFSCWPKDDLSMWYESTKFGSQQNPCWTRYS